MGLKGGPRGPGGLQRIQGAEGAWGAPGDSGGPRSREDYGDLLEATIGGAIEGLVRPKYPKETSDNDMMGLTLGQM